MATRAFIGFKNGTTVNYVYCHSDGSPSGVGVMLQKYYRSRANAELLVRRGGGGIRILNDTFESTDYYGDGDIRSSSSPAMFVTDTAQTFAEYLYLYDGKWNCFKLSDPDAGWLLIADALKRWG